MSDIAYTLLGALLLLVVVREVFRQLLHPEGRGGIGVALLRGCRFVARRMGHSAMVAAGPISIGLVFLTWFLLSVLGWALLVVPHVPESFSYAEGQPTHPPFVDALYISSVTISTLGYGDIVPETRAMRIAIPLESVMGFGLLTASLTWMLSLYAPLARHRTLARHAHQLVARERHDDRELQELANMVTAATVDLKMTYAIYYFHAIDERECFARVALPLWELTTERARAADDGSADQHVVTAIDEFAEALAEEFLPQVRGAGTPRILEAYARDDARDPAAAGELVVAPAPDRER